MEKDTDNFEPNTVSEFSESQRGCNSNSDFHSRIKKWFPSWEPQQKTRALHSCLIEHNSFNETPQTHCKSLVSDGKHCWHKTTQS